DIKDFERPKKLPLISDILEKAHEISDADYIIYTNADIILLPYFYDAVFEYIADGYDAFAINRRRISKKFLNTQNLNLVFAETGKSHPGFDCFVFKRSLIPKFILENICIGIPFLEATLLYNLVAFSENFKLFDDKHLTIHIGMDVMPKRDPEYYLYNRKEFFLKILPQLKELLKAENMPYAMLPLCKRMMKTGLNPADSSCVIKEM